MSDRVNYLPGLLLALGLAFLAMQLAKLPFLSMMGPLVLAIILGIVWRLIFSLKSSFEPGLQFSIKRLLRLGIIFLGMQLNLYEIYEAGWLVILIAILAVLIGFAFVYVFSRILKVDQKLGLLTACGTAICGAAAIVATAPQIKAKNNEIAVATASIALLGTIFTLIYSVSHASLGFSPSEYGVFSGATLHEVAHVVAAGAAGGDEAVDLAVLVKLIRVALLVPVILIIGIIFMRHEQKQSTKRFSLSIVPWFIFGFVLMSAINTFASIPEEITEQVINVAYIFMGMAMVGIGLNVDVSTFKKSGMKAFQAGLYGSIILSVFGFLFVKWFL